MGALDTNLLVHLIVRDAAVHGRSTPQLAAAIEMMLNHEHLSIQDSDVVARALEQFRAQPKVGFSNCLVLEIARKAGHLPL